MAKTTLTIQIDVTAPNAGDTDWLVQAGTNEAEVFPSPHAVKDYLTGLGVLPHDSTEVLAQSLREALGGPSKRPRRQQEPLNPNRISQDGLKGRQRKVLKVLLEKGSWDHSNPLWVESTRSDTERVLKSLATHGFVRIDGSVFLPTAKGKEYYATSEVLPISPKAS